ncbi:sirohydrochlorin chelatase [Horticoccus sp. 23ND18S-11]|uniref:sirohydrochlorin chelatase n=1 Tax=Horticoccus sp. 23ND18S-11 TaxID=3391832 RepID=UPI0039C9360E
MIVALIDNGSLEPAAHRNLRAVATALSRATGVTVHAVSWKHSDRIPDAQLDDTPAWTLAPFVRSLLALGQREFVFVPFFISAQGAIGSSLRRELESLQREAGAFEFSFTDGIAARGVIADIVAERIRAIIASKTLPSNPPVIVVDHGGPSPASATLRNQLAAQIRERLGFAPALVMAASMEGDDHAHNRPLLAEVLASPGFDRGPVVIAPLFLSPGRHAGPDGDLAQIARAAESRIPSHALRCHFTELVGTHPLSVLTLADALRTTLSSLHAPILP